MSDLRIEFNKTIEEMGTEGYKPVLGPLVLVLKIYKDRDVDALLQELPRAIQGSLEHKYPGILLSQK